MSDDCSVVIATHNRGAVLQETLERLCELRINPRIVVVDNASTDNTAGVCAQFGDFVRYIRLAENIGAAARTIGAREAGTPFVAFCDDDCYWMPGSLACAVQRLIAHPDVAVINARVLVGADELADPACQAMSAADCGDRSLPGVPIVYFMAGACVMRTEAFLHAGGYHQKYFIGAEESLLALDLAARGWRLWYCADIVVRHHPSMLCRDGAARQRLVLRNRLWTVLLRRSARSALHTLFRYVRAARRDRVVRAALADSLAALPWIVRERRAIPPELEARVKALDHVLTP